MLAFLCILGKFVAEKNVFIQKNRNWIKNFENNRFLKHFLYDASCFELGISNVSDLEPFFTTRKFRRENFLESARFRTNKFDNGSDFKVNLICKKNRFWWMFCLHKIFYGTFYTQSPNFCSYLLSKKNGMEKKGIKTSLWTKTFAKNQILKQIFNNASDFESRFSKHVRFLVNFN